MLVFTAATGLLIVVKVILKSEKSVDEIPVNWKLNARTLDREEIIATNGPIDVYANNEDAMCGGPICTYHNKITMFCQNVKEGEYYITASCRHAKTMDALNVFEQTQVVLFHFYCTTDNGHHSRLEVPLLDYIFDDKHKWFVYIGVSYVMHYWQVVRIKRDLQDGIDQSKGDALPCQVSGTQGLVDDGYYLSRQLCLPLAVWNSRMRKEGYSKPWMGPLELCTPKKPRHPERKGKASRRKLGTCWRAVNNDVRSSSSGTCSTLNTRKGYAAELLEGIVHGENLAEEATQRRSR
jgi:hypothetical protein